MSSSSTPPTAFSWLAEIASSGKLDLREEFLRYHLRHGEGFRQLTMTMRLTHRHLRRLEKRAQKHGMLVVSRNGHEFDDSISLVIAGERMMALFACEEEHGFNSLSTGTLMTLSAQEEKKFMVELDRMLFSVKRKPGEIDTVGDIVGAHDVKPAIKKTTFHLFGAKGIAPAGRAGVAFEQGNYDKETVEKFQLVARELPKQNPHGNLVILGGPPGTGKTKFIESLMVEIGDKVDWLFVQHHHLIGMQNGALVDAIENFRLSRSQVIHAKPYPCMPSAFGGSRKERMAERKRIVERNAKAKAALTNDTGKRPIVLVCEDADDLLVARQADNMTGLSALLNLADGTIGNTLEVRLILSANRDLREIDQALLRRGRLLTNLNVKPLSAEQASERVKVLSKGLCPEDRLPKKSMTLADVYALAYEFSPPDEAPVEADAELDEELDEELGDLPPAGYKKVASVGVRRVISQPLGAPTNVHGEIGVLSGRAGVAMGLPSSNDEFDLD